MEKLIIDYHLDGKIEFKTEGFEGDDCRKVVDSLASVKRGEILHREATEEEFVVYLGLGEAHIENN